MDDLLELHIDIVREALQELDTVGTETNFVCPFCEREGQRHRLHINFTKRVKGADMPGAAMCHGCDYGARGLDRLIRDIFGYVPRKLKVISESRKLRRDLRSVLFPAEQTEAASAWTPVELPKQFRRLPRNPKSAIAKRIAAYAEFRGLTADDIDRHGLGYVHAPNSFLRRFLIFPYFHRRSIVYWQGRRAYGEGGKNYNPKGSKKVGLLYNHDNAVDAPILTINEGPLDAIAWTRVPGCVGVAMTRLGFTDEDFAAVKALRPKKILVCFDGKKKFDDDSDKGQSQHKKTFKVAAGLSRAFRCPVGYLVLRKGDPWENRDELADKLKYARWFPSAARPLTEQLQSLFGE